MRFNREKFVAETCGGLGASLDCIDCLVSVLAGYIRDDETAGLHGSGCYGKNAEEEIMSIIKDSVIEEYIDI